MWLQEMCDLPLPVEYGDVSEVPPVGRRPCLHGVKGAGRGLESRNISGRAI